MSRHLCAAIAQTVTVCRFGHANRTCLLIGVEPGELGGLTGRERRRIARPPERVRIEAIATITGSAEVATTQGLGHA